MHLKIKVYAVGHPVELTRANSRGSNFNDSASAVALQIALHLMKTQKSDWRPHVCCSDNWGIMACARASFSVRQSI